MKDEEYKADMTLKIIQTYAYFVLVPLWYVVKK